MGGGSDVHCKHENTERLKKFVLSCFGNLTIIRHNNQYKTKTHISCRNGCIQAILNQLPFRKSHITKSQHLCITFSESCHSTYILNTATPVQFNKHKQLNFILFTTQYIYTHQTPTIYTIIKNISSNFYILFLHWSAVQNTQNIVRSFIHSLIHVT